MLVSYLLFSIPLRWIHLQRTRITRLFAGEKFFFFYLYGRMRRLYAYAVNEFALSMMSNADVTIPYFLIF